MTQHRHGAIQFGGVTGGSAVEFCRVENLDFMGEPKRTRQRCAGNVVADLLTVDEVNPQFKFDVKDLEVIKALLCHPYGNTVSDVDLYMREVGSVGPTAAATTSHDNYSVPAGMVYWTALNMTSKQDIVTNVVLDALFDPDGLETQPVYVIEDVAYPSVSGGAKIFTLGLLKLNGTAIPRVQSVQISNEFQFEQDDDIVRGVYKERTIVNDSATMIRVKTKERFNWLDAGFLPGGTSLNGSTGLTVFARRKGYAESATEHTKIVASTGQVFPLNAQGQGSQLMVDEFVVECTLPASGSVLAFTTGQAIS